MTSQTAGQSLLGGERCLAVEGETFERRSPTGPYEVVGVSPRSGAHFVAPTVFENVEDEAFFSCEDVSSTPDASTRAVAWPLEALRCAR